MEHRKYKKYKAKYKQQQGSAESGGNELSRMVQTMYGLNQAGVCGPDPANFSPEARQRSQVFERYLDCLADVTDVFDGQYASNLFRLLLEQFNPGTSTRASMAPLLAAVSEYKRTRNSCQFHQQHDSDSDGDGDSDSDSDDGPVRPNLRRGTSLD